jgi:hypothetical protein
MIVGRAIRTISDQNTSIASDQAEANPIFCFLPKSSSSAASHPGNGDFSRKRRHDFPPWKAAFFRDN